MTLPLKEEKERKRDKAFALWLSCHTQEEIAAAVDVAQNTVTGWEDEFIKKLGTDNFVNSPDFTPPIYNVWKQQDKTAGVKHFGNSEIRWLENLLYLYTKPADIIVDPFAGSGAARQTRQAKPTLSRKYGNHGGNIRRKPGVARVFGDHRFTAIA